MRTVLSQEESVTIIYIASLQARKVIICRFQKRFRNASVRQLYGELLFVCKILYSSAEMRLFFLTVRGRLAQSERLSSNFHFGYNALLYTII